MGRLRSDGGVMGGVVRGESFGDLEGEEDGEEREEEEAEEVGGSQNVEAMMVVVVVGIGSSVMSYGEGAGGRMLERVL